MQPMQAPDGIHIFGGSASGTTTLGAALAQALELRHLDTDDYYWLPTQPPFTRKREPDERVRLLEAAMASTRRNAAVRWVLSGSLCSWGDALVPRFALAVRLSVDPALRMARLLERERTRHGARIEPGGDMRDAHCAFVDWARRYDSADASIRSLALHRSWSQELPCPVLSLDSARPVAELVEDVRAALAPLPSSAESSRTARR